MPTKTEIIEAGARVIYLSHAIPGVNDIWETARPEIKQEYRAHAKAALDAMLPLIKKRLAAEVRGGCVREVIAIHESHGAEVWCPVHKEHWPCVNELATQLIERFEL